MRWPFVACILRAWVSVRFQEIFHDSESRYLRCPIKFRCPPALGGLINMTKECHIGKFMEQQALRCRYFAGGCKVADGQDNIYDAVWLVFHRPIVVGKETAREGEGAKERRETRARTISLSLKQLILLFRWHLPYTGLSRGGVLGFVPDSETDAQWLDQCRLE